MSQQQHKLIFPLHDCNNFEELSIFYKRQVEECDNYDDLHLVLSNQYDEKKLIMNVFTLLEDIKSIDYRMNDFFYEDNNEDDEENESSSSSSSSESSNDNDNDSGYEFNEQEKNIDDKAEAERKEAERKEIERKRKARQRLYKRTYQEITGGESEYSGHNINHKKLVMEYLNEKKKSSI